MGFLRISSTRKSVPLCCSRIHTRVFSRARDVFDGEDAVLPVLIVGAGPVGLALSILLTKLGVKCAVLEKNTRFSEHPQAHFINNRSMEIFRKINGLADEILRYQPPVDSWRKFIYCKSLTGQIFGSVDHMRPEDFDQIWSPVSVAHFSQYKLTRLLIKRLEAIGFHVGVDGSSQLDGSKLLGSEILLGHECLTISETEDCLTLTARLTRSGKQTEKDIKCRFVVGTDGASSTVRKLMRIGMKGEKDIQKLISVHFTSRELGRYLMEQRPGMLFFVFNAEAIAVLVAHDLKEGEFVLQVPFYPPQQQFEDFDLKTCKETVFKLVGKELSDVNILDIKPWAMHAEVAERFLALNDRVILAGDAAHRFPPAGGFGMNTGIQDAHNLAWKLASVLRGITSPSFLSTYETERRQIAMFNTALSVKNFHAAMSVPAALGLNPTIAKSVHGAMNSAAGSILPTKLQKTIFSGIFGLGLMQLSDFLLNESNPVGSSRLSKLRRVFEEGKSLQLQFPAEDLGFRYAEGALVKEDDDDEGSSPCAEEYPSGRRRDYVPSSKPGARLPHMKIRLLSQRHRVDRTFSTHDISAVDELEFVLIIAPSAELYELARSAFTVAEELKLPLKVCIFWERKALLLVSGSSRSEAIFSPRTNFVDVIEAETSSPSWWDVCGMADGGAILVRPDDHIAWRAKSGIPSDPVASLRRVFGTVLGLPT